MTARANPIHRHEMEKLAIAMVSRGARSPYVHSATGLPVETVARIYRGIMGRRPPRGPLKDHAHRLIRTRPAHIHASLFLNIYEEHGNARDPWTLIKAYDLYFDACAKDPQQPNGGVLDLSGAWLLAQDYRLGEATLEWCERCDARYAALAGLTLQGGCPMCAAKHAKTGTRKRDPDGRSYSSVERPYVPESRRRTRRAKAAPEALKRCACV